MSLLVRWWRELKGANRSGIALITGLVTTSTGGTLTGTNDTPGFTVTKTAAKVGRYDIQLIDQAAQPMVAHQLVNASATVHGAAADAAYTAAKALGMYVRNNNITTTGAFQIQMVRTDTFADAEVEDAAKILIDFGIKLSSAVP